MTISFDLSLGKNNLHISKKGISLNSGPKALIEFHQNGHYELQAEYDGRILGNFLNQTDFDLIIESVNYEFQALRSIRNSSVCLTRAQIFGCMCFFIPGLLVFPLASRARAKESREFRRAKDRVRALLREKNACIGDSGVSFEITTFDILDHNPTERLGIRVIAAPFNKVQIQRKSTHYQIPQQQQQQQQQQHYQVMQYPTAPPPPPSYY